MMREDTLMRYIAKRRAHYQKKKQQAAKKPKRKYEKRGRPPKQKVVAPPEIKERKPKKQGAVNWDKLMQFVTMKNNQLQQQAVKAESQMVNWEKLTQHFNLNKLTCSQNRN
jgi:hypothetical protein